MIYRLRVTSWATRFRSGVQVPEHYYGRIRWGVDNEVDLEHEIEICDSRYSNSSLECALAKPGEKRMSVRFLTSQEVVKAAREWMAAHAKPSDTLEVEIR